MPLPKQVQQQVSELDELEKQLYGDAEPTDPEKPVAEVVQLDAQQSSEPTAPKAEEPVAEPEAEAKSDDDDAKWKQKYKTLQGMYDAEVPRLHQQVKELTTQLSELKETVTTATQQAKEAEQRAEHERLKNLVTDEDRQEFGEDLIEVQRKVAREETAELLRQFEELKSENTQLRELMQKTDSEVNFSSFQQRLNRLVPDFEQVNTDPAWVKWLDEHDPLLRAPRRVVAEKVYAEGDAEGVAHFVKLFRDSQAPASTTTPSQELESQIQPSKNASASSTTATPKGKLYTSDQVRQMFLRVTQLNKMGNFDEARKLEAEIDSAYMQGRVRE